MDLIEKLEQATGPDRLLDGLIMAATNPPTDLDGKPADIFIRHDGDYGRFKSFAGTPMSFSKMVPHYTASFDAAAKLVPNQTWDWGVYHMAGWGWRAWIKAPDLSEWKSGDREKTAAIALCIAAIKSSA